MKPNQFALLAVVAAVSLLAAIGAYSSQVQRATSIPAGAKLFAGLEKDAKDVSRIEISQGKRTITLDRSGDAWGIKEKDGFLASAEKVRALIVGLTEAELAEAKTKSESHYRLLELEDPKSENANSYLVRLLDTGGKPLAELIVGKKRLDAFGAGRAGSYVRRPGEEQTWLITRDIDPGVSIKNWARDRLFELRPDRIKSASIEAQGEPAYVIERDADARTFKLAQIPDGKKMKYINAADDIVDTMSSFNIDEVRKAGAAEAPANGVVGKASLETDDGLKIALSAVKGGDSTWMTVTATGDGAGKAAADDLTALAKGWEFKMPSAQFDRIFKKQGDLLEDKTS